MYKKYSIKDEKDVEKIFQFLKYIYPIEYDYCSRSSLFSNALGDDIITREQFDKAKEFYNTIWYYTGD